MVRRVDRAVFRPRPRVDSAILRLRRRGPGADAAHAGAGPRRLRPPPQVAGALARARSQPGSLGPARAALAAARPARRRPRRGAFARAVRHPVRQAAGRPRLTPPPDARPRPRQAQPLPLPRAAPRGRAARALLAVRAAGAGRPDHRHGGRARRGRLPGGRGGEPRQRRPWRRCASAAGSARRCGSRSTSGCRSPPASAAAAATPPRSCASAAGEVADLEAIAAGLGADVPSQLRPVAGPGARRRRAGRAAAARRPRTPPLLLPDGGGLRTADVFAEADRLGLGRDPAELEELAARLRARGRRRRLAALLSRAARQRPRGRRRARCARRSATRSTRCAKPAPRSRSCSGSGPTAVGLFPDLGRGAGRGRGDRSRRRDRLRGGGGAVRMPGDGGAASNRKWMLLAAGRRSRSPSATTSSAGSSASSTCRSLLEDISNSLGAWTYLLVGVFAFAETGAFVGLIVPGETVMLLGGAVAGQGAIDIYLLIAVAWFSAWAGDTDQLLHRPPARARVRDRARPPLRDQPRALRKGRGLLLPPRRQDDLHRPLHQPGPRLRPVHRRQLGDELPRLRPLQRSSAPGSGPAPTSWSATSSRAASSRRGKYAAKGAFVLATLIVVVVGAVVVSRHFRVAENRRSAVRWMERHTATRWLVGLGRRYRPQLQFLWDRVTPGGTFGLEFTSLMATLAVALFVLIAYIVVVGREPGPTPGDETAIELVGHLHCGLPPRLRPRRHPARQRLVTWSLTAVCAALLAARRRWNELWVLLAGMAIASIGIHEIKAAVDRPRPPGPAGVAASGSSFPSGHADPLGPLRLARGDDRAAAAAGDGAGDRRRRRRPGADRARRALARLPQRPLPQRRQRAAGRSARHPSRFCAAVGPCHLPSAPESAAVTVLALTNLGHQYVLYGAAGLICLVVFVGLILSPALERPRPDLGKGGGRLPRRLRARDPGRDRNRDRSAVRLYYPRDRRTS